MSIRVMARVWQHSLQRAGTLLVLLAIADYADEGGVAFPSVATLGRKARLTDRGVQKVLKNLVASGELALEQRAGPAHCNVYRVLVSETEQSSPRTEFTPNSMTSDGEPQFTPTVNQGSPKPSFNRQKNRQQQHARARARVGGGDLSISEETPEEEQCPLAPHTYTGSYGDHLATDERHRLKTGRGRARGEGGFQQLGSLLPDDVRERLARRPIHVDD